MKDLARWRDILFAALESPADLSSLDIDDVTPEGFAFLRGLGASGYKDSFRAWLQRYPRPLVLVALHGRRVDAWVFVEALSEETGDGQPLYVLRSIETLPRLRRRGIGHRLLLLTSRSVKGHVLTKPLSEGARAFFLRAGFTDLPRGHAPVDARRFPGYLILSSDARKALAAKADAYFVT